jgi:hypothetical protein
VDAACLVTERFFLTKLSTVPSDVITIVANNDTYKNIFTSLHRISLLLLCVCRSPGPSTDLERPPSSEMPFPTLLTIKYVFLPTSPAVTEMEATYFQRV